MPGYLDIWGFRNLSLYLSEFGGGPFRVVYHPTPGKLEASGKETNARRWELEQVCRMALALGEMVLCLDEVWWFTEPGWMPDELAEVVLMGRTAGVTLIYTAQRPQIVASDLRACTTHYNVFRIQSPLDLQAIKGWLPEEPFPEIPNLPDRSYIWRDEQNRWGRAGG
jgi:hypothetical protein